MTRSGSWDIPPFLRVNGGAGFVRLNCLHATPQAAVIDIEVSGGMGSIGIVVPDVWGADVTRLRGAWGWARSRVPARPGPGGVLLVLHGTVGMGSLKVRHPNWFSRHRTARQRPALPGPSPRDY